MRNACLAAALLMLAACGPFCGPTAFYVSSASADAIHACPEGAAQQTYDLHVILVADNPTSSDVAITSASADMIVATVHGRWQQPVGFKYNAGTVPFSPTRVPKGSTVHVIATAIAVPATPAPTAAPVAPPQTVAPAMTADQARKAIDQARHAAEHARHGKG